MHAIYITKLRLGYQNKIFYYNNNYSQKNTFQMSRML